MNFTSDSIYHIYNRGNQQQKIFFNRENYLFFLKKMRVELSPYCEFINYCLMPNHFHWLVKTSVPYIRQTSWSGQTDLQNIHPDSFNNKIFIRRIANLLSSYSQAINKQNGTTGGLFQKKTKAKLIMSLDEGPVRPLGAVRRVQPIGEIYHDDFLCAFNYNHQNPWKARLVKRIEEWEFSSMRDYAGFRNGTLCNQKLGHELLGITNSAEFMRMSYETLNPERIRRIF